MCNLLHIIIHVCKVYVIHMIYLRVCVNWQGDKCHTLYSIKITSSDQKKNEDTYLNKVINMITNQVDVEFKLPYFVLLCYSWIAYYKSICSKYRWLSKQFMDCHLTVCLLWSIYTVPCDFISTNGRLNNKNSMGNQHIMTRKGFLAWGSGDLIVRITINVPINISCSFEKMYRIHQEIWTSFALGCCCDQEFSAQRASKVENVSIWWRHHDLLDKGLTI